LMGESRRGKALMINGKRTINKRGFSKKERGSEKEKEERSPAFEDTAEHERKKQTQRIICI